MKERNLCEEASCNNAICCRGSYFAYIYPVKKVLEWFPQATKVNKKLDEQVGIGVYYTTSLFGLAKVRIVGPCPNLSQDDNCLIYDSRPADCEKLAIGSDNCVLFRRAWQGVKSQNLPVIKP